MIKSTFKSGNYYCLFYAREEEIFNSEKIVCPQRSPLNTFAYNDTPWFAASDVYFITRKNSNDINLKYVLALLNSKLYYIWLYHRGQRKGGDNLELFKRPLSEIFINKKKHKKPYLSIS